MASRWLLYIFFLVIKHFYLVLYLHFKLHLIHYRVSNGGKSLIAQFPYRTTWTYIFLSWFEYVFLHDPSEFFNSIVHFLNKLRADCKQVFLKMIIGIQLASVHFFLSIKFFFGFCICTASYTWFIMECPMEEKVW